MKLTPNASEASFNRKKAFLLYSISKIVRDKAQIVRDAWGINSLFQPSVTHAIPLAITDLSDFYLKIVMGDRWAAKKICVICNICEIPARIGQKSVEFREICGTNKQQRRKICVICEICVTKLQPKQGLKKRRFRKITSCVLVSRKSAMFWRLAHSKPQQENISRSAYFSIFSGNTSSPYSDA